MLELTRWTRLLRGFGFTTEPEKLARAAFVKAHPDREVMWTQLAADEPERFVVGVYWNWGGKPPFFEFFEVNKRTCVATPLSDDAGYRPKTWR